MNSIYPIVMAGGTGSRLWPLSRELYPKQFIRLYCQDSMLQATVKRLHGLKPINAPLIICNEEHRFLAAEQLREINQLANNIILEPFGRNTAPAVALAALQLIQHDPEAQMLVLAADHIINNEAAFYAAIRQAQICVEQDKLATFGIVPHYPETGYGYIKKGSAINQAAFVVDQFVEKPDHTTAIQYLNSGQYLWNSGMFMFKARRYLEELQRYRPEIYAACQKALAQASQDLDFVRIEAEIFKQCPAESIDYAVMENTADAVVIPMDAGWSDVGSWASLWDISDKDPEQNVIKGDVIALKSHNNYIRSNHKLVTTVGVDNLVIVETKDAVLVIHKDCTQEVKGIIDQLKSSGRSECSSHREVFRPWGKYDLLERGTRYQVKHTKIKPGERIALQLHHHRSEHWIVVSGTAKVTLDDQIHMVTENQSIYIPIGAKHAVENMGKIDLEMIEVQSGSYLDEDDIVRFENSYGR